MFLRGLPEGRPNAQTGPHSDGPVHFTVYVSEFVSPPPDGREGPDHSRRPFSR
jgi:hypothetical protein